MSTLQSKARRGGKGEKSAFSESQLIQRESLRNRIRFLIFRKILRHFKVKAKILYLIKEYRKTNGQKSKVIEGNDSLNEN